MRFHKWTFLIIIVFLFPSCGFDKTFHKSHKISLHLEKITHFNFETDTTYIKYDPDNEEIALWDNEKNKINDTYTIENEYFQSSSGNVLNGWMLKPNNRKPIGTILHFHGSAINLLFHYEAIAPLVEEGFQIFTFDYSGYGFSGGKSTRKNALADAYSALKYIKNIEEVNGTQLIIYGQSYGGYLAAIVASNKQEEIDGVVIEGAFSSHRKEAVHMSPFWGNIVNQGITAEQEIQKNKKPVLIIHSREDKTVPFKFGQDIFAKANEPKEFYAIDKPHINGLHYYADEISEKIKKMLQSES